MDVSNGISQVHDTAGYKMIIVISILLPLVTLVCGLRLYTRMKLVKAVGLDDWVTFSAMWCVIGTGMVMGVMTKYGLGRHVETLSPRAIENYLFCFYLSILFYYTSLGLIKYGILLQYYPLVAVKSRTMMLLITIGICAWSMALVLVQIFSCRPVWGFWKTNIGASCIPNLPLWYINAAGNIVTDLIIFALPIPIVWKLQMPRSQRISLLGVFCLGFFTCTISILRIDFLNNGTDFTYNNIAPAGWSLGELCSGIICACLPTLRPLLFRVKAPLSRRKASMALARHSATPLKSKSDPSPRTSSSMDRESKSVGTIQSFQLSLQTVDEEIGPLSMDEIRESRTASGMFRNVM